MVETGLVIFALLSLTLGLVQFGMVYNAVLTLNNLARESARFAAVRAQDLGDTTAGRAELRRLVVEFVAVRAQGTSVQPKDVSADGLVIEAPRLQRNAPVRIVIKYDLIANKSFVPALVPLPPSYRTYEASAVNLIE